MSRQAKIRLKQGVRRLAPSQLKALVQRRWRKFQRKRAGLAHEVLTFEPRPGTEVRGDVLVAYIIDAFALKDGPEPVPLDKVPYSHTQWWESLQIVQTFLDMGYRVDAIDWRNTEFRPTKPYRIALDVRILLQHWAPHLSDDCIKIFHAETAHCSFHNPAQTRRLDDLEKRRGRRLAPSKMIEDHQSVEVADAVIVLGEDAPFTPSTYESFGKPVFPIPISTPVTWPELDRDIDRVRKRYVWFGSGGLVHKGLDLVLEAFAGMPDYHLTVCGPISQEGDFEREYWQELYETPNIHLHGWVDITTQTFVDLMKDHLGLVFTSCSEAQCGGVLTCMHAGLIPVVSYETGVPVTVESGEPERGLELKHSDVPAIQDAVRRLSSMDDETLKSMSHATWSHVQSRHVREVFAEEYRRVVEKIVAGVGADDG